MEQESNLINPIPFSADGYNMGISIIACMLISWVLIHRWNQRNKIGPKTWPLVGAAIEQFVNYNRMHDWILKYLSESKTVVVPMPFTTYTYIADPADVEHVLKTNFANYPKGEVYHSYMEVLLGDGIFNVDADKLYSELTTLEEERAKEEKVSLIQYDIEDSETFNQRVTQFAGLLTYDSLGRLSYLHAVVTETLRLYPAVPQVSQLTR
ncbi:hypothetical protein C3L33_14778, partial [Rhododendron williamsianum]